MQDCTINNALLALRRDGGEVQKLAERLLAMRGVNYLPRILAPRRFRAARRGVMPAIVLDALRDGPKTLPEVTAWVHAARPELDHQAAYTRSALMLSRLKRQGLVRREGRVWGVVKKSTYCQ